MALVKVFSALGVKTVQMMGNVSEQAYDEVEEDETELPDFQAED